jgi:tight adherence protein C
MPCADARAPAPVTVGRPRRPVIVGAASLLGTAAVVVAGPPPAIAAAVVGVAVVVGRTRRRVSALRRTVEAALPDAIELLVLCVHAGRSPAQAVVELARRAPPPLGDAFGAVERQLHRGRRLADALAELPKLVGPGARELASSIAIADREGLPLAPVLDRLAAEARADRRRLGEAAARRLPVRLSFPLVVCTLPSFVLLAIAPAVLGAISTLRGTVP